MDSLQVNIRTISPLYVPIELKTGVDRSSSQYINFQRLINDEFDSAKFSSFFDTTTEYESIEKDSWDNRLFIWEDKKLDQDLEIHVFPNNIGIVVINHTFEY